MGMGIAAMQASPGTAMAEPSTKGLGTVKAQFPVEGWTVQDLVRGFDRGARMPYVERNFRRPQTMSNP
jgi:hypothetical protein